MTPPPDDTPRTSRRQERRDAIEESRREIESWLAGPGAIVMVLIVIAIIVGFIVVAVIR